MEHLCFGVTNILALPKAAALRRQPPNDGLLGADQKQRVQGRKEALLFEVALLGVDYQRAKDKPPAESDASAATEQDYLSRWPTPHLEEAAFVLAA